MSEKAWKKKNLKQHLTHTTHQLITLILSYAYLILALSYLIMISGYLISSYILSYLIIFLPLSNLTLIYAYPYLILPLSYSYLDSYHAN